MISNLRKKVRQTSSRTRFAFVISLGIALLILLIWQGYAFDWTGFNRHVETISSGQQVQSAKTLWDWMQLLIIPVFLALGAIWFNRIEQKKDQDLATDSQRENVLQSYFDKISELIIDHGLAKAEKDNNVTVIARARTLTALTILDKRRKSSLIRFLWEANLTSIINLNEANLVDTDLYQAHLNKINLASANLSGANLCLATLQEANLFLTNFERTNLYLANLSNAKLCNAKLSNANLTYANLEGADLEEADMMHVSLKKANLKNADLSYTNLEGANLEGANLTGAKLKGTNLRRSNLKNTILDSSWLLGPYLEGANLEDASFTNAKISLLDFNKTSISQKQKQEAIIELNDRQFPC